MRTKELHLIDKTGNAVSPSIRSAVEEAYRWVLIEFPVFDSAIIANLAECLARDMQEISTSIRSERRYAYTALQGRILDWRRRTAQCEITVGLSRDVEELAAPSHGFQGGIDCSILFQQLKATLNERDRHILVLLVQHEADAAEVAAALGIKYDAARKAIQRVRERIDSALRSSKVNHSSGLLLRKKGLEKKWI